MEPSSPGWRARLPLLAPAALLAWRLGCYPLADAWADAVLWIALWLVHLLLERRPERRAMGATVLITALFVRHTVGQLPYTLDMLRGF